MPRQYLTQIGDSDARAAQFLLETALRDIRFGAQLTAFGVGPGSPALFESQRAMLFTVEAAAQMVAAADWLLKLTARVSINHRHSSYGLKHMAERCQGAYISNGALIVAALGLGINARRLNSGPNIMLAVCSPSLELRTTQEHYDEIRSRRAQERGMRTRLG